MTRGNLCERVIPPKGDRDVQVENCYSQGKDVGIDRSPRIRAGVLTESLSCLPLLLCVDRPPLSFWSSLRSSPPSSLATTIFVKTVSLLSPVCFENWSSALCPGELQVLQYPEVTSSWLCTVCAASPHHLWGSPTQQTLSTDPCVCSVPHNQAASTGPQTL